MPKTPSYDEITTPDADHLLRLTKTTADSDGFTSYSNLAASIGGALIAGVQMYAGSSAPTGWAFCDGSAVSRTTYSSLYAIVGDTYGSGDGSTTFNLPDMREASPVGIGTRASGVTAEDSYTLGQFKDDQMQGHWHGGATVDSGDDGSYLGSVKTLTAAADTRTTAWNAITDGTNGTPRTGTTTRGKRLGINFIIKLT